MKTDNFIDVLNYMDCHVKFSRNTVTGSRVINVSWVSNEKLIQYTRDASIDVMVHDMYGFFLEEIIEEVKRMKD